METQSLALVVHDANEVGAARRAVVTLAERLGCTDTVGGKVALVVTELATNLVRHGGGGELLVRAVGERGLEIVAIDRGPGMGSVEQAFRDGYSTGGTNGTGLGAVRRIADGCDIFSAPGAGTAVLARIGLGRPACTRRVAVSGVSVAMAGEMVCGDAWAWSADADRWSVLMVDGLGHGPTAAIAAAEAVRIFGEHPAADPVDFVRSPTRRCGPPAVLRSAWPRWIAAGAGDIHRRRQHRRRDRDRRQERAACVTWPASWATNPEDAGIHLSVVRRSILVLYSDGLQSRWQLEGIQGSRREIRR